MIAPGPDAEQLERILSAAIRVPDHGKLAPWRFVVIAPEQRDALADLLHRAYRETRPEQDEQEEEATHAERSLALRDARRNPHPSSAG